MTTESARVLEHGEGIGFRFDVDWDVLLTPTGAAHRYPRWRGRAMASSTLSSAAEHPTISDALMHNPSVTTTATVNYPPRHLIPADLADELRAARMRAGLLAISRSTSMIPHSRTVLSPTI